MAGRSALCISSFANGAWGEDRRHQWTGVVWRSRRRRAASTQVRLALLRSARNLRRGAAYPLRIAPRFGTRTRGYKELHTRGNRKNMAIQNRLTQTLGIERPVLLAPMDLVSGGRLAAAISHAGGLGLLGGGYGDGDWLDREWQRAGNARIGCGFITWSLAKRPQVLERALTHRPAAIMLSFGDPRPFAPAIRNAGARLICQVQTLPQAREAVEAGADVIVAQGTEGGGHGMSEPLFTLLPQVVDACPGAVVVAAGGIADGRGMAAALMLGAQGVLMGTRFYASQEAEGHAEAKRRIVEAEGDQT